MARAEFLSISAIVDANGDGDRGFEAGPGAQVTLPLFDRQQGRNARAAAAIDQAAHRYATVRNQIVQDVRTAHARFLQSQEALAILQTQRLVESETVQRRSEAAHRHGEISLLEVLRASQTVIALRTQVATAKADARRSLAELERALGRRLESLPNTAANPEATP